MCIFATSIANRCRQRKLWLGTLSAGGRYDFRWKIIASAICSETRGTSEIS